MTPAPVRSHWNIASFWSSNAVIHQCAWWLWPTWRFVLETRCAIRVWYLEMWLSNTFHAFKQPDVTFSHYRRAIRTMWLYPARCDLATMLVGWIRICLIFIYFPKTDSDWLWYIRMLSNVVIAMLQHFGRLVEFEVQTWSGRRCFPLMGKLKRTLRCMNFRVWHLSHLGCWLGFGFVISRRGGDGGSKPQGYISTPEASVYGALWNPWETSVWARCRVKTTRMSSGSGTLGWV